MRLGVIEIAAEFYAEKDIMTFFHAKVHVYLDSIEKGRVQVFGVCDDFDEVEPPFTELPVYEAIFTSNNTGTGCKIDIRKEKGERLLTVPNYIRIYLVSLNRQLQEKQQP